MGRDLPKLPAENRFRERIKQERIRLGWSQADLSKLLQRKGLDQVHPTTVAKIESGERWVRLAEANALADLFEVSVDALLGRPTNPSHDAAYLVRSLRDAAGAAEHQVMGVKALMRARAGDVYLLDFEGLEELQADCSRAFDALTNAQSALRAVSRFRLPTEVEAAFDQRRHDDAVAHARRRADAEAAAIRETKESRT